MDIQYSRHSGYKYWISGVVRHQNPFKSYNLHLVAIPRVSGEYRKKRISIRSALVGGMLAEWIGVHYGILFGTYSYGANLGAKIDGVPLLIGINWALLTFITARIAQYLSKNNILQILLGATLMLLLDYFMEHSAPRFDFWEFKDGLAPLKNYITWFLVAVLFHTLVKWIKITGDLRFSMHLYAAQLLFFVYFFS